MKSFHLFFEYCLLEKLVITRNACKYDALIVMHRCSLLNRDTIMHSILTQEDVINEALNVN